LFLHSISAEGIFNANLQGVSYYFLLFIYTYVKDWMKNLNAKNTYRLYSRPFWFYM